MALNMSRAIGGDSFAEALAKVFGNTPIWSDIFD